MKKAKMLLVAALVFGVILSSYGVSGTYAKYISEGGFTDQARIAKWGFTLGKTDKSTASLFKDNYNSNKIKSSSDGQDVIAPGAYGEYQFSYIDGTATPEVAFNLTATAKVTNNIGDDKVKFAIVQGDDATHAIKSSTSSIDELQKETSDFNKEEFSSYNLTASQLETLLKLLLSGDASGEKEYTANDTAVAKLKGNYTIYWMWDFGTQPLATEESNKSDTNLGNGKDKTSGEEGTDYTAVDAEAVSVTVSVTAAQTK